MIKRPITIQPSKIVLALGLITAVLVLANISGQLLKYIGGYPSVYGFVPSFHIRGESNVPAYFSSLLLASAALLLRLIAGMRRAMGADFGFHWLMLSIIFLYLSLDEIAQLHERLNRPVNQLLQVDASFHFTWLLVAFPAVLIFALCFWRFWRHLPATIQVLFAVAAGLYVGGAGAVWNS